jgi:hypothetical protein
VAVAAITLASVARAEAGLQSARAYANPVFEFLAGNHVAQPAALHGVARQAQQRTQARAASQAPLSGAWIAMLPVLFIGVVSPLNQLSPGSVLCLGGMPSAPLLPGSFQRPPPFQIA